MPEVLVSAAKNDFELLASLPANQLAYYNLTSSRGQLKKKIVEKNQKQKIETVGGKDEKIIVSQSAC